MSEARVKSRISSGPRDPRERFVELANKRVTAAIRHLRLVGNLANRRAYTYSEMDAKKILRALADEMDVLKSRFRDGSGSDERFFSIDP